MTLYFFDLVDNGRRYADSEGVLLEDDAHAVQEARGILGDLVRDGTASDFDLVAGLLTIVVRTAEVPITTLKLTLSVEAQAIISG